MYEETILLCLPLKRTIGIISMKLTSLILLATSLVSTAAAAVIEQRDVLFVHTAEDWQAKWDAWPTSDGSNLRRRLSERTLATNQTTDDIALNVCERITGCIGSAAATAAGYATVAGGATASFCSARANDAATALSANNYALARQIAAFVTVEVALPFIINFGTFYINLKLQNAAAQSSSDSCGISQQQAIADQAGTATYGFCLQLQKVSSNKAFSRVDFGTVSADNSNDDIGLDMEMRLFISTVKGKYASACSLLGLELKRRFALRGF
ncbi:hypothetical protein BDQ12DRAFT_694167 [Crucibulum laeve]|uniref:Uncharacterized protein n=1 Tax=Crucibulum laeve TaxID=68775 RepID=A0A5C3LRQ4_9AGAR|nr:hypothetical protein BDQ12DRAFT_694167 [Crucibulum laeve]